VLFVRLTLDSHHDGNVLNGIDTGNPMGSEKHGSP
jgi:hypothetical protein